tara:strand:+ start:4161 stop:4352 length:192 start_codon:yes stop_codon:yes gene_type:complete
MRSRRENKDIHLSVKDRNRFGETIAQDFVAIVAGLWLVGYRDSLVKEAGIAALAVSVGRMLMD